jgi:hypothetical protein
MYSFKFDDTVNNIGNLENHIIQPHTVKRKQLKMGNIDGSNVRLFNSGDISYHDSL